MSWLKHTILLLCTFVPSPVRLAVWRLLGFRVGRGCRVSISSVVVADTIELGPGAVIEPLTLVYRPRSFSMGERSRIASFVRIIGWQGTVSLGPQTFVALGCLIDSTGGFELADRSQIGPRSMLYTHGATGLIFNVRYPSRNGPVRIGKDCWICMGCVVYPNVTIGDQVVILPGAIVQRDVKEGSMILPLAEAFWVTRTSFLQDRVARESQLARMKELLRQCAACCKRSEIDDSRDDLWTLRLSRKGTVYLVLSEATDLSAADVAGRHAVVWTLARWEKLPNVPRFCFADLTVAGPWTPFAERIAAFLCEKGGTHFVFEAHGPQEPHE